MPGHAADHPRAGLLLVTLERAAARLGRARTAYGFINGLAELSTHPALRRASVDTPGGLAEIIAPPILWDGSDRPLGPVPGIGEHSAAIRAEFTAEAGDAP